MNYLDEEIAETTKLIRESDDLDVRYALRDHLEWLLEMHRHRIARYNKVAEIRLGNLVLHNPEVHHNE